MSKLSAALKINDSIRIKTFEVIGNKFKVKIPLSLEMEAISERIKDVSKEKVDAKFNKMVNSVKKDAVIGVEFVDDDVVIDGKPINLRNTCVSVIQMEQRILEYFKLLVPESGDFSDITYDDIEAEFPMAIQFEMLERITESIQPGYKDARKN
jgi:hypothetical protein